MATLFVSDLHLDPARPDVTRLFGAFLDGEARAADALYILGDLFEAWVGDDDPSETGTYVAQKLRALADAGVPVHFQRGNRDFLVGPAYAARAGIRILPDPAVIVLDGAPVLLSHGDLLCTGDEAYQAFRAQTRDPDWQARFLAQPLQARLAFAAQARAASTARQGELAQAGTMEAITDVAPAAVEDWFVRYGVDTLIHGHTHRPAIHALSVAGRPCRRIVLGDWYTQGSVLSVHAGGCDLRTLAHSPPHALA
jgi:UDP-2,3-diacylglucosamine hydrolase